MLIDIIMELLLDMDMGTRLLFQWLICRIIMNILDLSSRVRAMDKLGEGVADENESSLHGGRNGTTIHVDERA